MASEFFSDIASTVLSKTLDASAARQKAIANNIANVETPGYKRSYVAFEDALQSALQRKNKGEIKVGLKKVTPIRMNDIFSPAGPNGNNVNIDTEIADLGKTGLKHKAVTVLLQGKSSMLRTAVWEGKR